MDLLGWILDLKKSLKSAEMDFFTATQLDLGQIQTEISLHFGIKND